MDGHVKVSGVWKKLEGMHVKVSGTWKQVNKAYVRVSGTWKQFFAAVAYSLSNIPSPVSDQGGATTTYRVTLRFQTDGTVDILRLVGSDSLNVEQYVDPGSESANLHVRVNKISGDSLTGGDAESTWHALTSERTFEMEYTSSGGSDFISGSFDIELSEDGGSTTLLSVNRTITAGEVF